MNKCIDCRKILKDKRSLRCRSCSKKGNKNPKFGIKPVVSFSKGHIPWNKGTKGLVGQWNKKPKIKKECLTCHKNFEVIPARSEKAKYCSKKCFYASRKGKPITWLQEIRKKGIRLNTGRTHFKKGFVPWVKGKKMSADIRKKNSESHKGKTPWNKGKKDIYSKETIEKIRVARLNQVFPKKDTLPEQILFKWLEQKNIKFIKHFPIGNICQTDVFIKPNICIFADGDYWHANPAWMQKTGRTIFSDAQTKNIKRDKKQTNLLLTSGYQVIRLWESTIKNSLILEP